MQLCDWNIYHIIHLIRLYTLNCIFKSKIIKKINYLIEIFTQIINATLRTCDIFVSNLFGIILAVEFLGCIGTLRIVRVIYTVKIFVSCTIAYCIIYAGATFTFKGTIIVLPLSGICYFFLVQNVCIECTVITGWKIEILN